MTVEHKTIVGLEDVTAVIFECRTCGARVTVSPENARIPQKCPACPELWLPKPAPKAESSVSTYVNFLDAFTKIRAQAAMSDEWPKFRILLQFDVPQIPARSPLA